MFARNSHHILALSAAIVVSAYTVSAQPAPRLNSLSREWVQRGSSAELTLSGENLGIPKQIIVSGAPGVSAEIVPAAATTVKVESSGAGITAVAPPQGKSLQVKLKVDDGAALTERELRLVTEDGVSNPLPLKFSHLPEVDAAGKNSRESAQEIALPTAISGTLNKAAESHFFKFKANKDEHVIVEVFAHRSGSKLDSSLAILDSSGKELARSEDAAGLDSVLDFAAPADGEYFVELRDFRYQGAGDFKYRLIAGVLPYVRSTFPFGGQRGQTVEVQLTGANLDGASKILLQLAPEAALGRQEIRTATPRGLSNPFPFDVSDLPSFAEKEPNTAIDQADVIKVPIAIDGRINVARDYDAFKFSAAKDQRVVFEVHAFSYGSPLDALLTLADASGKTLQRNDDAMGSDARLDHTFKEAGEYVLIMEDLLNRGGEQFRYRVTASVPQPDFSVALLQDVPRVRRAGRVPIRCEVTRVNGFNEAVQIVCEGLPAGVYAEPLVLAPEAGSGYLVLNAMPDAPKGSFPLNVRASAAAVNKAATAFSGDKGVKAAFITVLDTAPFSVAPATLLSSIEQSQSGKIDVVVERRDPFAGEIKITPEGFSTGREPITRSFEFQPLVIKANESRGTLTLKAKPDSEVTIRHIILKGEAEVGGQTMTSYSQLIPAATIQIPYVLSTTLKKLIVTALPSGSASAASEATFAIKAERRSGFAGEIELKIDGLPEGVTAPSVKIASGANEAQVKLTASEKAPAGKEVQLTISGAGTHNDRVYRYNAPPITLTVNAPETEEKKEPKLANTP
jgi:hypothetical protein